MKKLSFVLFILIITISFQSCENETTKSNDFGNLKEQLKEYNNKRAIKNSLTNKERGFWGWVGVTCATVAGDVIGAAETMSAASGIATAAGVASGGTGAVAVEVVAGVVGAAGGSYVAYNAATADKSNNNSFYITNLNYPPNYDDLSNVGMMHNSLLEESFFNNTPINNWIRKNYVNLHISDMNKIFSSKGWKNLYSHIENNSNNYKMNNYDYSLLIEGSKEAKYLSDDLCDFYELFFEAYTKALSFEDMVNVVKQYSKFVIDSDISEKDKRTILFSLDVAVKSPVYWIKK